MTLSPAALVIVLGCMAGTVRAQTALLNRGDRYFKEFSFVKAAEAYEMAFKKDASSIPHARRLAKCYWNIRDTKHAENWYAVVAASSLATPLDVYRYSELLRVSGNYAAADMWLRRYGKMKPEDSRVRLKENAMEKLANLLDKPGITYKVTPVNFNSDKSDIAPFIHKNTIYFASSRTPQFTARRTDSWNDQPFLNIYTGDIDKDGNVTNVHPMGDDMNTQYHESNVVISDDGSELYFNRNNYVEGRKILSEDGVNNLQIFVRHMLPEGWGKEKPFAYNSPSYSVGHPALSKDGQRLYFTSDKAGGIGGKDIYVCYRDELGAWGEPQNLGPKINTEGDEMFPYIFGNTLYFASDGHLGLGGLDLFRVSIRGKKFGVVENLNAPINSTGDDFGFCLDERGQVGFFTSDRDGNLSAENIYTFRMNSKAEDNRKWAGRVLDMSDAQPIPYLTVRLLDAEQNEIARSTTDAQGTYEFPAPKVPAFVKVQIDGGTEALLTPDDIKVSQYGDTDVPDIYLNSVMDLPVNAVVKDARSGQWLQGVNVTVKDASEGTVLFLGTTNEQGVTKGQIPGRRFGKDQSYDVVFAKSGYFTKTLRIDFRVLMFVGQALTGPEGAGMLPVASGVDIAKAMNLLPIHFDYRESEIRSDAAGELDQVAHVLRSNPSIKISLRSHTDSRASDAYNDALSQRRAESAKDFLVKQGVATSRIIAKGYGKRELLKKCADGVPCTEADHQMNRRMEFIITNCTDCPGTMGATN